MDKLIKTEEHALGRQRWVLLYRIERWLEWPMLGLSFVWLALLVGEMVWGLSRWQAAAGTSIWVLFILYFMLQFFLAPRKAMYLRRNWITALSLLLPALRLLRIARLVRAMRAARAVRSLRLVRLLTSLNRGMKALGKTMRRRGMAYVLGLTLIVAAAGAAGLYAFEAGVPGGPVSYSAALWWTSMLLISMGTDYWPQTPEGRLLCLVLAVYGFAVFGYFTAALASFFIGQDASNHPEKNDPPIRAQLEALGIELMRLQSALASHSMNRDETRSGE